MNLADLRLDRVDPGRQPRDLSPGRRRPDAGDPRVSRVRAGADAGPGQRVEDVRDARPESALGAGAGGEISRALGAAVGDPGRRRGRAGRAPLSQAPPRRLRHHALPGRESGTDPAPACAAVRRARVLAASVAGLRAGRRRPGRAGDDAAAAGRRRAAAARVGARAAGLCRRIRAAAGICDSAAGGIAPGADAARAAPRPRRAGHRRHGRLCHRRARRWPVSFSGRRRTCASGAYVLGGAVGTMAGRAAGRVRG